ncbi:oligosaccharide flippase family protein [Massilimicrobiota sp. An80]|uniref:lipopolysaccharide biosynthesis protein n=1 Tax=Massilimicrobiota sp. An80 TaxID=1965658 RepID=UPI000B4315FB|nr:oligosaccharide flippase family protein [Massilimicrobiota sp. An80]OUN37275.1 hypothetical protein B5G32_04715 [Massilimicrobiota sp. An80]
MNSKSTQYSFDVVMQAVARISGGILSFVAVFLLTYLFSESDIGYYNIMLSTLNIITSLSSLWLSQGILRYYEEKKDFSFIMISTLSVITFSLLIVFMSSFFIELSISAYIYVITLIIYNVLDAVLRKERKLYQYVILELAFSIGRLFPMVLIAYITHDIDSIFISQSIIMLIYLVFLKSTTKITKNSQNKFNMIQLKQYLGYGMPLIGLSVSNWLLVSSDRYLIKYFESDASVGIYSTIYSLGNSIYMMFALIIVNAFHPIIVNTWNINKEETYSLISKVLNYYLLFTLPIVFYGCLKANVLLSLFKGNSYAQNDSIFIWTALGIFIYGFSLLYHKYYELQQKTMMILVFNLSIAILNIVLNIILIPRYGFPIAAFTTFVSYMSYLIIVRLMTFRAFPVKLSFKTILLVGAIMLIFFIGDNVIVQSKSIIVFFIEGIIFVVYTMLMYQLLKIFDIRDLLPNHRKK